MSLQYSGSTIINRTAALTTRVDLVNFITQAMLDAGWTTISGTPGAAGTTLVIQETAAGNQGQKVRARSIDPASGTCAQFTLSHISNSPVSQTFFASPAFTWHVVATKFHFFAFVSGSANRLTPRTNIMAGILYAPSFLPFSAGDGLGFMAGNSQSDTDVNPHQSWRTTLRCYDNSNSAGRFSGLLVAGMADITGWVTNDGAPNIAVWQAGQNAVNIACYRWQDNTLPAYEPLVCWGSGGINSEGKFQGQLYDAMVMNDQWNSEATITYDGHTWIALTDQATGSIAARATLFIAVT